jgi:hypothetical protein
MTFSFSYYIVRIHYSLLLPNKKDLINILVTSSIPNAYRVRASLRCVLHSQDNFKKNVYVIIIIICSIKTLSYSYSDNILYFEKQRIDIYIYIHIQDTTKQKHITLILNSLYIISSYPHPFFCFRDTIRYKYLPYLYMMF